MTHESGAAAAAAMPAAKPARFVPRVPRLEPDCLASPEQLEAWASKNAMCYVPLVMWERFHAANRSKREDLEAEVRRLEGLLVLYEARIRTLETNTTGGDVRWAGEHEPEKSYEPGELCRRRGAVWICVKATTQAPGLAPEAWELMLPAGPAVP